MSEPFHDTNTNKDVSCHNCFNDTIRTTNYSSKYGTFFFFVFFFFSTKKYGYLSYFSTYNLCFHEEIIKLLYGYPVLYEAMTFYR